MSKRGRTVGFSRAKFKRLASRRGTPYGGYRYGRPGTRGLITRAQAGYVRTSGFYGRFSGRGGESKFLDTTVSDAPITAGMVIANLTVIPEGNTESQRVGRKVTIKSIHVKGTLTLTAATALASTTDKVFGMLVLDKQTNGAAFAATDLLDTDSIISFRQLANTQRFSILMKKVWTMSAGGAAPTGAAFGFSQVIRDVNINKRCNIPMEYDNSATTGAITTVRSNNVYWVTQSGSGLVVSALTARIRYVDY